MTREHAKQLLPIIKAWSEGAEIQIRAGTGPWVPSHETSPTFECNPDAYRIKPQPREFWVVGTNACFPNKEEALNYSGLCLKGQPIHVREVIPS